MKNDPALIAALNDLMRAEGGHGAVLTTPGVLARGRQFLESACSAMAAFDEFDNDNDPHGEHDFGALDIDGVKLFWKIDYYDESLIRMSPNPADDAVTFRVLTLMLAAEY